MTCRGILHLRVGRVLKRRTDSWHKCAQDFLGVETQPQARVSDDQVRAVSAVGYNDAQIAETLLTVAQTVFAILFNRVH